MKEAGRTVNTVRSIGTSVGGLALSSLMNFVCRTVFIYTLGKDYLGISSLYTNVITILSLSELGFSTVMQYCLFRPLARNNRKMVAALMRFYKKAYRIVGCAVLVIGLVLMPFLPYLMTGVTDQINIYLYYLLYLAQSAVSYFFFAYKSTLLIANQQRYLYSLVQYGVQIVISIVKILVLVLLYSFFFYTVAAIAGSILTNLIVAVLADRIFPYLNQYDTKLTKRQRRVLFYRVYAAFLNKISNTIGDATDNLIISANISVLVAGMYSNYYMIISVVQNLILGVFQAATASLGNYFVKESKEKNYFLFRSLMLANNWIVVFFAVCFLGCFQIFIQQWIGEEYLLSEAVLWIIVLNFAMQYLECSVQIFRDATGLFVRGKYRPVATAILNLVISLILVRFLGLAGVFLGTIIARLLTTLWYDAWLVCRKGFGVSPLYYYAHAGLAVLLICVLSFGLRELFLVLPVHGWLAFVVQGLICAVVSNGCYLLLYGRTKEFHYLVQKLRRLLEKRFPRLGKLPRR